MWRSFGTLFRTVSEKMEGEVSVAMDLDNSFEVL